MGLEKRVEVTYLHFGNGFYGSHQVQLPKKKMWVVSSSFFMLKKRLISALNTHLLFDSVSDSLDGLGAMICHKDLKNLMLVITDHQINIQTKFKYQSTQILSIAAFIAVNK